MFISKHLDKCLITHAAVDKLILSEGAIPCRYYVKKYKCYQNEYQTVLSPANNI